MDEKNEVPMIPQYQAESTYMHMSIANKRMFVVVLAVCITFIITIVVFTRAYTDREKHWLDTFTRITQGTEVQPDGVHQFPDAGTHP